MKKLFAVIAFTFAIVSFGASAFGQTTDKTKSQKKTSAAKKPQPPTAQPLTIPKDAVQNPDGTYSFTDKAGKKWIYAKSPFGISKTEDVSATAQGGFAPPPGQPEVKAIDNGDTVKFQKQTPFGPTSWEKKKTELTDEERHILDSQKKPE